MLENDKYVGFAEAMERPSTVLLQKSNNPWLRKSAKRRMVATQNYQYVHEPLSQHITVDDVMSTCKSLTNDVRMHISGKRRPDIIRHFRCEKIVKKTLHCGLPAHLRCMICIFCRAPAMLYFVSISGSMLFQFSTCQRIRCPPSTKSCLSCLCLDVLADHAMPFGRACFVFKISFG